MKTYDQIIDQIAEKVASRRMAKNGVEGFTAVSDSDREDFKVAVDEALVEAAYQRKASGPEEKSYSDTFRDMLIRIQNGAKNREPPPFDEVCRPLVKFTAAILSMVDIRAEVAGLDEAARREGQDAFMEDVRGLMAEAREQLKPKIDAFVKAHKE